MISPKRPDRSIPRRRLLGGLLAALLLAHAAPTRAQDRAAEAGEFVRRGGVELIGIINGPDSPAARRAALLGFVDRSIDVDGVARFCLGRYIHTASPEQVREYVDLFRHVLTNSVGAHLGEYKGVTFRVTRTVPLGGGEAVGTVITRPNNAPANVQWVVGFASGEPKIIDVIAEGTSLRVTQRSDYASFLQRNGGDLGGLLRGMRRQVGA